MRNFQKIETDCDLLHLLPRFERSKKKVLSSINHIFWAVSSEPDFCRKCSFRQNEPTFAIQPSNCIFHVKFRSPGRIINRSKATATHQWRRDLVKLKFWQPTYIIKVYNRRKLQLHSLTAYTILQGGGENHDLRTNVELNVRHVDPRWEEKRETE